MRNTELQKQNKNNPQNSSGRLKDAREDKERTTRRNPTAGSKPFYIWIFNGALLITVFILIGLQSIGLLWLSNDRTNDQALETKISALQSEVVNLRSLMETNMAEELIYLKILVLNSRVPNQTAREIASAVYHAAKRYERDPDLILSIMRVESYFDPTIVSHMGAIGLMQIMPQWIDVLDIRCDLNNPECNIRYGLQILGAYEQLYGNLEMALTAYNRGPGPVDYALMRGKDPDNGYAGKIHAVYDRLRAINRSDQRLEVACSKQ